MTGKIQVREGLFIKNNRIRQMYNGVPYVLIAVRGSLSTRIKDMRDYSDLCRLR